MAIDTLRRKKTSSRDKFDRQKNKAEEFFQIRIAPDEPDAFTCLAIALALITIILIVRLAYIFAPEYRKNLVKLISTVGLSLLYNPVDWMEAAIKLTSESRRVVCEDKPEHDGDFDFYVFGHSLGGLLALSWPCFVDEFNKTKYNFSPKQILTALLASVFRNDLIGREGLKRVF